MLLCALSALSFDAIAVDCESLTGMKFGSAEVVAATVVAAGSFDPPGPGFGPSPYASLNEFCRVQLVATPARQSEIGIEVWLPGASWNGKLLGIGNGAWGGSISHTGLADAINDNYAAVATDTGHTGMDADFLNEHRNKLRDFAYRAVHEMTVAAKAVISAVYQSEPQQSYFSGCSTGGRQALIAAQRYPDDYDGIIAGAPAHHPSHLHGMQIWTSAIANRSADAVLTQQDFSLINNAAMAACDVLDGVADNVIEDPRQCSFDPGVLACEAGQDTDCLQPGQLETARMIYAGPTDAAGNRLYPGLAPGSEAGWRSFSGEGGWTTLAGTEPMSLALETYELLVYPNGDWDWRNFDPDADISRAARRIGSIMDAINPDLTDFIERGGKLLLYHGWSDPGIPPAGTIDYYRQVHSTLGSDLTDDSVRLFMVPGMGHCRNGTGTDSFDALSALDRWIATDEPPERIEAKRETRGTVIRSRPLCAYPATAVYDALGDSDQARSFVCR